MAKRKQAPKLPELPPSHLNALARHGFKTLSYLNKSITVDLGEGNTQSEWLPRLCIAPSGNSYRVIEWMCKEDPGNAYSFDGWQVHDGHTCGGFYQTISQALGWFVWFDEQAKKRA